MQFKDIKTGIDYAILRPNVYKSKHRRDPNYVSSSDVLKGHLVDMRKYKYDSYSHNIYTAPALASVVPQGEKVWGVLVETKQNDGSFAYIVVRTADVLAPYDELSARWTAEQRDAEANRIKQEEKQKRDAELLEIERGRVAKQTEYLNGVIRKLTHGQVRVEHNIRTNSDGGFTGFINMSIEDFTVLVESMYEAIENAA